MMEVTINVPGLKELAEAIKCLAEAKAVNAPHIEETLTTEVQAAVAQPVAQTQQNTPAVPATPPVTTIQQTATAPNVQTVPTTAQNYTLDDLARAGMSLIDCGHQGELCQLLEKFGVMALPALPPAQYGAFATALREMGAKI